MTALLQEHRTLEIDSLESLPHGFEIIPSIVSRKVFSFEPNKLRLYSEIARVLEPGGTFQIRDLMLVRGFPEHLDDLAEMYLGYAGPLALRSDYLRVVSWSGLEKVEIISSRPIPLPTALLSQRLSPPELINFLQAGPPIHEAIITGRKPVL